jgi:hypothetical protein
MTFRTLFLVTTMMVGLGSPNCHDARAGLLGPGRTVQAFYYNGTFASPEGEIPVGGLGRNVARGAS